MFDSISLRAPARKVPDLTLCPHCGRMFVTTPGGVCPHCGFPLVVVLERALPRWQQPSLSPDAIPTSDRKTRR